VYPENTPSDVEGLALRHRRERGVGEGPVPQRGSIFLGPPLDGDMRGQRIAWIPDDNGSRPDFGDWRPFGNSDEDDGPLLQQLQRLGTGAGVSGGCSRFLVWADRL
jgi:hypothetical protein